jgi:multiple sugar transport system permease protein
MPPITSPVNNKPRKTGDPNIFQKLAYGIKGQELLIKSVTTFILALGAVLILTPFVFMISTSLKDQSQLRSDPLSIIPRRPTTVEVNGKQEPLYKVNLDGEVNQMALIKKIPGKKGQFVDPASPDQVYELLIADQKPIYHIEIHWENFKKALTSVPFDRYFINTMLVVTLSMLGMLTSCTLVAYGFSRFRAPGLNILFLIMIATIMLPSQVRLIPVYVMFQKIGWVDTLLPLIIPAFFANPYDVFLLRQFFMTIPLELDDAAKIDGANPLQTLMYVVLPQARPAIVAVAIFHFLFAWNDFYEPLIFLHSRENWTLAVGLQTFDALYSVNTHLIMAASLVMIIPPVLIFFFSQRIFTQGVVFTGIKG